MDLPQNYSKMSHRTKRIVREEYIKLQNGKCYYCGGDLNENPPQKILDKKINLFLFPENFLKYPVHLHHDHNTGLTLGSVHAYCNGVLFQYHGE